LTTRVTPLTTRVTALTTRVTPLTTRVTPLTTRVTPLTTRVTALTKNVDIDVNMNMNINMDNITKSETNLSRKHKMEREKELKRRQLSNVPASKKLRPNDIHRIVHHTDNSIFDEEKCALWTGYITNLKNKRKGTYINFYFKDKKKVALHRLLYANFKGEISNRDYIKYSCSNKGKCCNVNHMVRFEYNSNENENENENDDSDNEDFDDDVDNNPSEAIDDNFKIVIY